MQYKNTILLKLPKRKIPLFVKLIVIIFSAILSLLFLYYFFINNDLVNYPYFPSSLVLTINHITSWIVAILVFAISLIIFISISESWIKSYKRVKLIQFILTTFLWSTGIFLSIFFANSSKTMSYLTLNAIFSQFALYIGTFTQKQGKIFEHHSSNLSFQQQIQITRGKTKVLINDPVSYKFNIKFYLNNDAYNLEPYCYSASPVKPFIITPTFKINGFQSYFGFRCTSGCELYQYFKVNDNSILSSSNFTTCKEIYISQPSIK